MIIHMKITQKKILKSMKPMKNQTN